MSGRKRKMGHLLYITLLCVLTISYSNGCDMSPPGSLWLPQTITITDTFRGVMFSTETINIQGVQSITSTQNLNGGPYFAGSFQGSTFTLSTNDAFDDYEENETIGNPNLNIIFNCVGGTTRSLTFIISITDTNNNAPQFIPSNELEFTIIPPLPPGFSITGCLHDITVRDIDLTTQRIDFEIYDSPLFEISYDAALSTVPKEFQATLRTTTFIRSLPEPIEFQISATDVDQTGDPPITVYATVRITALEDGFVLPDEPVFTRAYYLATYTTDHQVILEEKISLQQGYTDNVQFSLDQGATENFAINRTGNDISLDVKTPLSPDLFLQRQIRLVIKAEIENTSGANAAIIIDLPEEEALKFAQPFYEGAIVDNVLQISQLVLSQGYQGNDVSVEILDYAEFFDASLEQNSITLTMSPLNANIIEDNAFLNIRVVASTNTTSVLAVVSLEIIKDDTITPVFGRAVYEGLYNATDGLDLDQIILVQGYDETVQVSLQGEYASYFTLDQAGPNISLQLDVPSLPTQLFSESSLLLYLRATKPRTVGATAAISIALPAEEQLEFEQQYYRGYIEDNVLHLTELTLSKGYEGEIVTVSINSNYASFFQVSIELNIITLAMSPLDDEIIEQNTFLNLEVVAATTRSSVSTIVTLEIIKDDTVTPVFDRAVYEGSYDPIDGLTLDEIMLTQGYDETVRFSLNGEHAGYFQIERVGALINLTVSSLPTELFTEQNLILTIEATKPRKVGANAAISIALPEEIQLEFEQPNYKGVIEDNDLQLTELILSQGYNNDPVSVSINDDYASYFEAEIEQNKITLYMSSLDSAIIDENAFINLHVTASTNRSSAITIVTLEIIKNDTLTPVFERALYEGTYDPEDGLKLDDIVLVQGYDETVDVYLQGEHAGFFQLVQQGPTIRLTALTLPDHLHSMNSLLLSLEATKPRTVGANAAISIILPEARDLQFEAATYSGTIQENLLELENITLTVGFTDDVIFTLTGEHASYFNVTNVQNQISVDLQSSIPANVIEENNFLLLTLSASALNAVTTSTTIAIEVIKEDQTTPLFSQNIYYGTYTGPSSISIGIISLSQGFDDSVSFRLDGEHSQYFRTSVAVNGAVSLELQTAIPAEVIFDEKVLLFSILAEKELTVGASAAVSINFPRELTEPSILRFSQNTYIGSLQQNVVSLEDVVLEIGYASGTQFELFGDYSEHFTLTSSNNIVRITATGPLPNEILASKFISFEVEAHRTRAVSVSTTIIIDIEQPRTVAPLVFDETYYRGVYTRENELQFDQEITLAQGFDESVSFALDGESTQWFDVKQDNDTVSIVLIQEIPPNVIAANRNLLFSIVALKPNANDGRAAIVIEIQRAEASDLALDFDQISYTGSIINNVVTLNPIILNGGTTTGVTFTLHGELANYFGVTAQGANIIIALPNPIPAESIPSNRIIVLEIQATAPQAAPAYATIVLHVVVDDNTPPALPELVFDAPFYVGSYTANGGLVLSSPITLAEGFGPDVVFGLEGDDSQWFSVSNTGNSVTLVLSNPIPPAVIANHQKLIFVISAQRSSGEAARSTVVISLIDEPVGDEVLGFDRISYTGSIENNTIAMNPIVLSQGSTTGVTFTLHGELANYFGVNAQGANIIIALPNPIPAESIPSNRIIVLEIQASAPQAAPAYATIVLHVVVDDNTPPALPELVFDAPFYVGSYTANGGLVLSSPITLAEGFGPDVVFALEGDDSQWFSVSNTGNSVTLVLSNPIPPAVIANHQKLIFVISAQRPSGEAARSTVVISLIDEPVGDEVLGFDRISYTGSIENNTIAMNPIVLSQGSTTGVTFTLHGELANYFGVNAQGANIIIALPNPIPAESIPSNRIIVLEIQASAPQAAPAYATIVLHVVVDDNTPPALPELVFDAPFYVGSYTANGGLVLSSPITLAEGFGPDVVFGLEGDDSQWFSVSNTGNSVTLVLSNPIPPAVIANHQKLIFVISAQRPSAEAARSTVVISLVDEPVGDEVLGFDRISYTGSIENNTIAMNPIVLSQGSTTGVTFTLHGELANYFGVNAQGANIIIALPNPIPAESIPSNRIIVLEIQASAPQAAPAYAIIVLHVVVDDNTPPALPELVFDAPFYVGSYTANGGLVLSSPITLAEGFGPDVVFALEGDDSQWFSVSNTGNSVTLVLSNPIPPAVIANHQKLIFVISAQRPSGEAARSTVVISLIDEPVGDEVLGFDRISYTGSIENNTIAMNPIVLSQGSTTGVTFTLHGELANYFGVNAQGANIIIALPNPIPAESIPSNRIIVLEIQASALQAAPAYATIVLHVVVDDNTPPALPELVFDAPFYVGSYTANGGLVLSSPITLAEGFGPDVVFALEGDDSQWFSVSNTGNSVTLVLSNPIPPAVIANHQKLIFVISAQRPSGEAARSTVVISLIDEPVGDEVLGFDRISYTGSIENNTIAMNPIVLSQGSTTGVTFTLHGELANYFGVNAQGANIIIALPNPIPAESIPSNRIIVLEIQASAPQAAPAYATIVLHVVVDDNTPPALPELVFDAPFYVGSYTANGGLVLSSPITLAEGFGPDVVFGLEGDDSQWFSVSNTGNSVTLVLSNPIPPAVIANHQKLIFVISAQRPSGEAARSTVVISLINEPVGDEVLGFDRISYTGSIENNTIAMNPIVLSQGSTTGVTFTLHGELANYFGVNAQGANIIIALPNPIPAESIPSNRIIVLEIQASALQAAPAYATIVLHVVVDDNTPPALPELVFDAPFYVGSYTANGGLVLSSPITLAEGFGPDVVFALEGDDSQWFSVSNTGNSVTLVLSNPIPPAVIANHQKLIFVISAQRPSGEAARSTVVISLIDEPVGDEVLGFDRISYTGSIENNTIAMNPIVLSQGSTTGVTFTLHGELANYFGVNAQGANIIIALPNPIPAESIPSNRIIVLEIQASAPQAAPAYATIVLHVVVDDNTPPALPELVFDAPFYVGSYTANGGLVLSSPITLAEGFGPDVVFALEGDDSQWFSVSNTGNSVTLVLSNPIPPAVIANHQKLIFVISAQRPSGEAARSTVVISLIDEPVGDEVLGFDRISYTGSIENNTIAINPIVLSQGSTTGVTFTLHGELANYFGVNAQGANIIIALPNPIPAESIPSNRIIVLEIQASAPQAAPAYATIVLHVVVDDNTPPALPELVFDAPFYVGSYTANGGLVLSSPITLAEGFGPDVVFGLEGDDSQWFSVTNTGSSVTLVLSTPIPPAVIANHQKLIFVISAQRPSGEAARSTVVISLIDEPVGDEVLGFDRISYTGSIENNTIAINPIVLSQGSTTGVTFTLHGELANYFGVNAQGANIIIALPNPIPAESIPSNRIIVLEIQASAPQAAPAYATIVLHVVVDDNTPPALPELVFDAPFYVGSYTANGGLVLSSPITLAEGFGPDVVFGLEGDDSQWFSVTNTGSSVTLVLSTPIPPAVIANHQKLIFVISAQRPSAEAARSTVVISLVDEPVGDEVLGFDRISYTGSIENNTIAMNPIVLSQGSTTGVTFTLHGELANYFGVNAQGANIIIALPNPIPAESIPSNRIIVLEIQASAPQAAPAYATIVLHVVVDDNTPPALPELVFDAPFYVGSYTANGGLVLSSPITLAEGFGPDVVFALEGDDSQWFSVSNTGNSVTLVLSNPIPPAVIANHQKLIFVISAQRPSGEAARSTVVISLIDEPVGDEVLGFDRISYTGSIENNTIAINPIVLSQGSTTGVTFTLHGELANYFGVNAQGANIIIALPNPIPAESIPSNRIIVLEIQASAPQAAPAYATIVLHVVVDDNTPPALPELVFDAPFYVGSFTANGGLVLSSPITLAEGFGPDVVFALEGDDSQWFSVTNTGNSVTLVLSTPIPPAVIANHQKLIFVISAQRPSGEAARSTVVISLVDEPVGDEVLGFDRISYTGSIENNIIAMNPIVLCQGSTTGVTFTLHGELANYFGVNAQGANIIIALPNPIPAESIPSNRIIVLEIQASAPQAAPAYATIVLHVVVDDNTPPALPELVFDAPFYVGSYTANGGLVLSSPITLAEGFGPDVVFGLEGDDSQWFSVTNTGNSVTLVLSTPIPPAVVTNHQKLIFVISAQRPSGEAARSTVVISLVDEPVGDEVLGFDRISYTGSIENNTIAMNPIVLSQGSTTGVTLTLHGELANYFGVNAQGANIIIALPNPIPAESIPSNRIIVLEIQASAPQAAPAYATLVLHVVVDDNTPPALPELVFDAPFYVGSYTANGGLVLSSPITLAEGFGPDVVFALEGDDSQWLSVTNTGCSVILVLSTPIPPAVIANHQKLIFVISAQRPSGEAVRSTVVISLINEPVGDEVLGFDRISYTGSIENNTIAMNPIVLSQGSTTGVTFTLHGELANYFGVNAQGANIIIALLNPIPAESIPSNRIIVLEIQASAPQAAPAYATIVLHVVVDDNTPPALPELVFDAPFYVGSYTANGGLVLRSPITLAVGFGPDVVFALEEDDSQWFSVTNTGSSVTLVLSTPIPPAVIANHQKLIFVISAQRPSGEAARSTVVISLVDEPVGDEVLGFDRISYTGSIENNTIAIYPIVLSQGSTTGVTFTLYGELANYFGVTAQGANIIIKLPNPIPAESIPSNRIIVLEIQASAPQAAPAYATIVLHVVVDDNTPPALPELVFDAPFYVGSYTANGGLVLSSPITLAEGFGPDVVFALEGDDSQWFSVSNTGNSVTLILSTPIPPSVIANHQKLIFVISAERLGVETTRAIIVISLSNDGQISSVSFDKVLYDGIIQGSAVHHETINVIGYDGTDVQLTGALSSSFEATLTAGTVVVQALEPLTLPPDTHHVVLEIRVEESGAVLYLQVYATEQPLPTVSFEQSYVFSVENRLTGPLGQVRATADNGEAVTYTLQVTNDHLQTRLAVSSDGELRLSAPAATGVYTFQVIATTIFTQALGQTTVQLIVEEAIDGPVVCGDGNIVTAPLIIINRDEEEEHKDLVPLNASELPGCRYTLTNRWPVDQNWLYVDDSGLHAVAIDREDSRIAFMALSQVQVELNVVCDGDSTRSKRSFDKRLEWLGPYDYGTNKWVLTDSIPFNPRRSFVNLIVNDINDNDPIFVGVEDQPIAVGYPISDLEETIMPRSLAELQATDADVGENAELLYWSVDPEIAVSPTTGFVHVRTNTQLQENMILTVNATDRNGEGRTGSITLMVKLLDTENIAVVTVREAFLEDENRILGNLSNAIGYEVRALRSAVVPSSAEETTRIKRDTTTTSGTSLEVYVYGLIQKEPVAVEKLSNDINSAAIVTVDIASIQSLEDHLEGNQICAIPGRDTGLLAATIVLSILLFILILTAVFWYLLTRKKRENYDQFSDANSLASQNESLGRPAKPEPVAKRLNIEELKRSERRLQDMLNAPISEVTVEPIPSSATADPIVETKTPTDLLAPIVIQDKLKDPSESSDDDEFGERKRARRKSVVTFNENVEKIIHVDDEPDVTPEPDPELEVYKF